MNYIWQLDAPLGTYLRLSSSDPEAPEPIDVTQCMYGPNYEASSGMYGGRLGERPSPAAELILTVEDFDIDFFTWGGPMFVSERMRRAMALDPSEIRFFDIDDSGSAPLPRSMKYQMMEPLVEEAVLDPEGSIYGFSPFAKNNPYGPTDIWRLALRPDACPEHDLFYDRFFRTIALCTDQFAVRILQSGCTGIEFSDVSRSGQGLYLRTLRGVEKFIGIDEATRAEITELVHPIP